MPSHSAFPCRRNEHNASPGSRCLHKLQHANVICNLPRTAGFDYRGIGLDRLSTESMCNLNADPITAPMRTDMARLLLLA